MKTFIENFIFTAPLIICIIYASISSTIPKATQSISFSIIAAYFFYFLTVLIPARRKQKIAQKILAPYFAKLKNSVLTLISIFDNLILINNDGDIILNKEIKDIFTPIYFKQNNIIYKESLATILQQETSQLITLLDKITANPSYQFLSDKTINHLGSLQSMHLDDNINRLITNYDLELKDKEFCKNICTLKEACQYLFKDETVNFIFPLEQKYKKLYEKTIPKIRKNIKTHQLYNIKKVTLNNVGTYKT